MATEALHHNAEILHQYHLHAYVVMPNHIHVLLTPFLPLPLVTKSIKNITARRANTLLKRNGATFWQDETYDRQVRDNNEFTNIQRYIENNPVKAGLATSPEDYHWSSAAMSTQAPRLSTERVTRDP
jgi:REP element-mobilizing transposase RayT